MCITNTTTYMAMANNFVKEDAPIEIADQGAGNETTVAGYPEIYLP
jgi:hypothetical protein